MAQNRLDYQAQLSRHPHPTDGGYAASLCTGAIVPQYFDILMPGDSVYYRTHMFARLQDLVTAFLGEVDIHLDYFFVPLQMLYTPCGQIYTQTNDFLSSIYADTLRGKDSFPLIKPDLESMKGSQSNSLVGTVCPEDTFHEIIRLFDALDANPLCVFDNDYYEEYQVPQDPKNIDFSICNMPAGSYWPFLAYQAIYQKYYRNDELEKLNVAAYNVDSLYNQEHFNFGVDWFRLRYHQRVSDFFTNMRPSPIMSSVNSIANTDANEFPNNGGATDDLLYAVNTFLGAGRQDVDYSQQKVNGDMSEVALDNFYAGGISQVSQFGSYYDLNANNIRALFAVDKYTRIYGRADKTYDDQILAHFGIKIPHDVKHDLTHLKHYRAVLQADPIYGTANVANSEDTQFLSTIGQVGGQGQVTLDTQEEKFTAPVHGVFMCVAYVLTKPRYIHTFSPLHLISNRLDLPIAEYDKLGAQPMYRYIYNPYYLQDGTQQGNSYMNSFSGWVNRYQQFKQKYNRCSLLYATPINGHIPADAQTNVYAPYVLSRPVFGSNGGSEAFNSASNWMDSKQFFEHPNALDSIMVRHYDGNMHVEYWQEPHLALQSDPILTDFMCYCKKVSWMSETGEPDL